ncbi:PilZ domain protein [Marinobacter litoralis]|uniref:PilZ domain protein n=1 Tax=Marinobacter litoralis TaxID=187981 RepID=A0A3M2RLK8_9GAMM|nr:PilZ domain-containing protein [Marinobacter litoralis]RMJ06227.1 PilZ domain protein [Marinobacter litoralis]
MDKDYRFGQETFDAGGADKREDYRLSARATARIHVESAEPVGLGGASFEGSVRTCEVRDLSASGMSLVTTEALRIGSLLAAEVHLSGRQESLKLMVEVVWHKAEGARYLNGIRVFDSDETDYLNWLEAVADAFSRSE